MQSNSLKAILNTFNNMTQDDTIEAILAIAEECLTTDSVTELLSKLEDI